jgi:hypothetical protein
MVGKIVFLLIFAVILAITCTFYDSIVSPQVESDMAIAQMEADDEAALQMRVASRMLAYQYPVAVAVWLFAAFVVLRRDLNKGIHYLQENL